MHLVASSTMLNLFAQAGMPPDAARDVLILPVIFTGLGAAFYFLGLRSIAAGGKPVAKWAGLVLIAFALYNGLGYVWAMFNPDTGYIYRSSLEGRGRETAAHYIAPMIPGLTLIAIYINHRIRQREKLEA